MTCAIIKFESELPETIRTLLPKHQSYSLTVRQDGDNLYVLVSDYSLLNTHSCYIYQKIVYNPAREEVIEKDNFKQVEEIGQIIFNACCNDPCTWSNLRERLYNFWRKKFWRDRRKTKEFEALNQRFRQKNDWEEHEKNRKDMLNLAEPIRLYQGSIGEVERDLSMRLKRIDTQTPETFLREHEALDLRARAAQLGANAVVHYCIDRGHYTYHIGTPVKFVGSLYRSQYDIIVEPRGEG